MLCDLCGKNQAAVHLTEIIKSQKRELHLCPDCAKEKGVEDFSDFPSIVSGAALPDLLAGLADQDAQGDLPAAGAKVSCPHCRMTHEEFRKSGRLGCGECYRAFDAILTPLLKRIHGSVQHVGRVPPEKEAAGSPASGKVRLARFKERLKAAVAAEDFEAAAQWRDQIRTIERKKRKLK